MKAGVLGVVDGSFRAVDSFTETVTRDDHELDRCLVIDRVFSLPAGEMAFAGRGAIETLSERTETTIGNQEITVTDQVETVTKYAEFVGVPGEFVAVDSSSSTFAFDLIAEETDTAIERAQLDLDAFFDAHPDATPWKAGFYGAGENAVNGVFHGEDLRRNHDLQAILTASNLNQVGLSYAHDGDQVKMTAARSGYVEVYQPSAFDSESYLAYLRDEIVPHVA